MAQEDTKQEQVNPADELKKAAEAAEQAQGSELPPELGIEPEGAEASLEDQLAAATAKAAENFDLYVRAVAEMENVRRRAAEDVSKAQKFSIEKFAKNLLPVMDSLEKAIEMTAEIEGPMREGILATHRQLMHALEMSGMTVIDPKDAKFDPNTQQAIAMVPAVEGKSAGDVAQVFQHGWKIHERVLRPAMVSVVQG
ncbi:nucleotide exchange factor GrpE [Sutterella sp. AM11-39]|uniref:nucleotide exchange factor GrpE n=1 Tax=Sutterella sp. AM11-39 TaxID=2292075 RepID=UPI000E469803|nr:nucleotide exchange factor GrpE [Sutterella sp. AM11-39]RHJ31513.1 nucleotide exchange factor GrpE [Sutterella sp. AM11-39]